ncbi:polysaccharide deacetylase family protein [Peribacillus sp. V2I11]|uniref:polysaccharide deacetylase family protein n=1 Tax=Peribacillus sp. V2I11 TaxID=3042277 RepID=UPI002784C864|nr:polysaccharide deacetylase family protein [Peribacillus sp. V2I11]MDQ0879750.1 peptidoglycan/xylan/chitin deacetylase (PgdA/CDA1 family) [Peribacillus sp. V2I11]
MINKVVALFTFASFLLMACNDPSPGQTENENEKSVETTTTVQDESRQEKDLKKETSKTIGEGNVKTEYRVEKENWSFKPIRNANPKVVLLTFDDAPDKYSLEIARTLKRLEVPAIFFVKRSLS